MFRKSDFKGVGKKQLDFELPTGSKKYGSEPVPKNGSEKFVTQNGISLLVSICQNGSQNWFDFRINHRLDFCFEFLLENPSLLS